MSTVGIGAAVLRSRLMIAVCATASALAGCGGGGGGSVASAVSANQSVAQKSSSSTTTSSSSSTTATSTLTTTATPPSPSGRAILVYVPIEAVSPADVQVPSAVGTPIATFRADSTSASIIAGSLATGTLARDPSGSSISSVNVYGPNGGNSMMTSTAVTSSLSLDHSSYGLVASAPPGAAGVTIGGYHYGTPPASMPQNVVASYAGVFTGVEMTRSNPAAPVAGVTFLEANFGSGRVSGGIVDMKVDPLSIGVSVPTGYTIGMEGQVSGTGFTGTTRFANSDGTAAPGSTTASSLNGGFYGPNAAEAAGALALKGTMNGRSLAVTGAFGAKKL